MYTKNSSHFWRVKIENLLSNSNKNNIIIKNKNYVSEKILNVGITSIEYV